MTEEEEFEQRTGHPMLREDRRALFPYYYEDDDYEDWRELRPIYWNNSDFYKDNSGFYKGEF